MHSIENSQNSESSNGPRRGLDFIALILVGLGAVHAFKISLNDRSNGDREVQC